VACPVGGPGHGVRPGGPWRGRPRHACHCRGAAAVGAGVRSWALITVPSVQPWCLGRSGLPETAVTGGLWKAVVRCRLRERVMSTACREPASRSTADGEQADRSPSARCTRGASLPAADS
jgi:hypothetical protein